MTHHVTYLRLCTIVAIALGLSAPPDATAATYSRTVAFRPLRMSYSDLSRIVTKIQTLQKSANTGVVLRYPTETLELTDGASRVGLTNDYSVSTLTTSMPIALEARYYFFVIYDTAPITRISLSLGDDSRYLTVEGDSREQVDALVATATEDLHKFEHHIGGGLIRGFGGVLLMTAAIMFLVFPPLPNSRTGKMLRVVVPVALLSSLALPWRHWLAGTTMRPANSGFATLYAPEISLVGLLLSIAGLALPFYFARRDRSGATSHAKDSEVAAQQSLAPGGGHVSGFPKRARGRRARRG